MFLITDIGVLRVAERTKLLSVFNVNKCPQVTYESLQVLLKKNPNLTTFHASCTMISDVGLSLLSTGMSVAMTSVDISFCAEITDFGIANLVETCPNVIKCSD